MDRQSMALISEWARNSNLAIRCCPWAQAVCNNVLCCGPYLPETTTTFSSSAASTWRYLFEEWMHNENASRAISIHSLSSDKHAHAYSLHTGVKAWFGSHENSWLFLNMDAQEPANFDHKLNFFLDCFLLHNLRRRRSFLSGNIHQYSQQLFKKQLLQNARVHNCCLLL